MVDVTHDRDDRRALHELALLVGVLRRLPYVVGRVDDLDLLVELVGQHLDRVVRQRLGERGHLAELHQLLDHLGRAEAERLADLVHGGAGVDLRRRLLALRLGRRREVAARPMACGACARVRGGAAAAGPVGHPAGGEMPASRSRRAGGVRHRLHRRRPDRGGAGDAARAARPVPTPGPDPASARRRAAAARSAGPASASSGRRRPAAFGCACSVAAPSSAFAASAPFENARWTSPSSTLEAAAFTSRPAF